MVESLNASCWNAQSVDKVQSSQNDLTRSTKEPEGVVPSDINKRLFSGASLSCQVEWTLGQSQVDMFSDHWKGH